jgi:hypothetical protein
MFVEQLEDNFTWGTNDVRTESLSREIATGFLGCYISLTAFIIIYLTAQSVVLTTYSVEWQDAG